MIKLLWGISWLLCAVNVPVSSVEYRDIDEARAILDKAKRSGVITPGMESYGLFMPVELRYMRSTKIIHPNEVNLYSLLNLRAVCEGALLTQLGRVTTSIVVANAKVEFSVLSDIIHNRSLPLGMRDVPPHIHDLIQRLSEEHRVAQRELRQVREVLVRPEAALNQSPHFSPARPRRGVVLGASPQQSERQLHYSPSGGVSAASPLVHSTPLAMQVLRQRRAQHDQLALVERQRDDLYNAVSRNAGVLGQTHAASQRVLELQASCLRYQERIARLVEFIVADTAAVQGNLGFLEQMMVRLANVEDNFKRTLECLEMVAGGVHDDRE